MGYGPISRTHISWACFATLLVFALGAYLFWPTQPGLGLDFWVTDG